MGLFGKLYRDLCLSRIRLVTLGVLVFIVTVYYHSCMLGLSGSCSEKTTPTSLGKFIPNRFDLSFRVNSKDSPSPTDSEILAAGGTYFRSTPLNRSQVEQSVNTIVNNIQLNDLIKRNEREKLNELREEIIRNQMETNLDDIDLEDWNLDNYYHMPRTPKPEQKQEVVMLPKQEVRQEGILPQQEVKDGSVLSRDLEEADGPEFEEASPIYLDMKPEVIELEPNQEVKPELMSELQHGAQWILKEQAPQTIETGSLSSDQVFVKKKKIINTAPIDLISRNTEAGLDPINRNVREISNKSGDPMKAYLQRKSAKKSKKSKKKKNSIKNATFLPNSFPYFVNQYPPARVGEYACSNSLCSEFLGETDKLFYKYCVTRMKQSDNLKDKDHAPGRCHFINGTRRAAVGLVSFPGSGNTWVRGLLEQATGVCTGSIYCDNTLRASGMNGEGVRGGAVLAVKTHKSIPVTWTNENEPRMAYNDPKAKNPSYGSAILIVRNPFNALIAEWNRLVSADRGHVGEAFKSAFGENAQWYRFIKQKLPVWQAYLKYWVVGREGHSVLVIKYEHLKTDAVGTVENMLDFLNFPYNHDELEQKLNNDFGTFKRKHGEEFEHFTPEQKSMIRNAISTTVSYLRNSNHGNTYGIEEYLE